MTSYHVEHIALDMTFYHPHGATFSLAPCVVKAYETDKEHAEIFTQSATNIDFSQTEVLNWFLLQTHTTVAEHLPQSMPDHQHAVCVTFPIRFKPGTFFLKTNAGPQDLSHLKLMCKVTIKHTES